MLGLHEKFNCVDSLHHFRLAKKHDRNLLNNLIHVNGSMVQKKVVWVERPIDKRKILLDCILLEILILSLHVC